MNAAGWEGLPLPALVLDRQARVLAMNDAAEIWLNLSRNSALGQHLDGVAMVARLRITPPLLPLLERVGQGGGPRCQADMHFALADRAGGHHPRQATVHVAACGLDGALISMLILPSDSGVQGANRAIRSATRSAIGMAEMLAHEIRNPLAGIRGAAQLIAMNAGADDREMADLIVSESRRIVALLDQVERFGDHSMPQLAPVNIHDVLERARRSASVGFAEGITLLTEYDPSLPPALADADQLMQVCLNLIQNAAQALDGQPDPVIRLRSFYDRRFRLPPDMQDPAGRPLPLQIEIEDNGPGLSPAIADEVFEPFVSGRENGTGLGLALVSKIMTDHRALVAVDSHPGRVVFRISLPRA